MKVGPVVTASVTRRFKVGARMIGYVKKVGSVVAGLVKKVGSVVAASGMRVSY